MAGRFRFFPFLIGVGVSTGSCLLTASELGVRGSLSGKRNNLDAIDTTNRYYQVKNAN